MTVGVVIVVAGRHEHLTRTLATLRHQTRPPDDVVVVDMADDATTARLVGADGRARLAHLPERHREAGVSWPLATARNAGVECVVGEHLVFLDVDCLAAPDLVETYDAAIGRHPASLICGPVRYLRCGWDTDIDWSPDGRASIDALNEASDAPPARPVPDDQMLRPSWDHELFWSLAFGTSRSAWCELGGFDDGYVGYGAEDTDFAQRARSAGVPMRWSRAGTAFHQWHAPSRADPGNHRSMVLNARRYRARWGAWPMIGWLRDLERDGVLRMDDVLGTIELVEDDG